MNRSQARFVIAAALLLLGTAARAQPALTEFEDTMIILEEGSEPEDIVGIIELPLPAADAAGNRSDTGSATAGEARENGRAFGQARAAEARADAMGMREQARETAEQARGQAADSAAETAQAMREAAREMREDARDAGRPDDLPDQAGGPR